MRQVKIHLNSLYPNNIYLLSVKNEDETDGNITKMGINLANEIQNYINENL